jgi:hypothetical protein
MNHPPLCPGTEEEFDSYNGFGGEEVSDNG